MGVTLLPPGRMPSMNSRNRVLNTLNHQEPDQVPLDLGASAVTGMHVASVYLLRQALYMSIESIPKANDSLSVLAGEGRDWKDIPLSQF
jgi:hypothetical protein